MTAAPDRWLCFAGYMGAGKSTVGRRTAARLGREFVDADRAIEQHAGLAIPEIFSTRGELWFRRTEADVIRGILQSSPPGVLALGGGALEAERTRDLLRRTARVVWLHLAPDRAWQRVKGSSRPLATDEERFIRRAQAREAAYRGAADLEVDASGTPEEIVARVVAWVQRLQVEQPAR